MCVCVCLPNLTGSKSIWIRRSITGLMALLVRHRIRTFHSCLASSQWLLNASREYLNRSLSACKSKEFHGGLYRANFDLRGLDRCLKLFEPKVYQNFQAKEMIFKEASLHHQTSIESHSMYLIKVYTLYIIHTVYYTVLQATPRTIANLNITGLIDVCF